MNRREALRTLAAGSAAGALAAGVVVVTSPTHALAATPIEGMTARLRLMFDADTHAMTDAQGDAHSDAFSTLQERIIRAEAQTPRDVALQVMADTHWGSSDMSDEFSDRLAAMANIGSVSADAVKAAPVADPMAEAVEEYEAAYALQGQMLEVEDWSGCEAIYGARIGPATSAILSGASVTTLAGAVAAVRYVANDKDWIDEGHAAALRAALAYLEGGAA